MKTIIFQGSPRKKGCTSYLVDRLCEELDGEVTVIRAYDAGVRPCIDCRYCFTHEGCAIQDDMLPLYREIEECDHIILASPVYFEELTGPLLSMLSRLQTYYSARYIRKEEPIPRKKTGAILLCAGSIGPREKAQSTGELLLRAMGCRSLGTVYVGRTDQIPVESQEEALHQIRVIAQMLNGSTDRYGSITCFQIMTEGGTLS